MKFVIIFRWILVAAFLATAGYLQMRFGRMIAFALKLPYDSPVKNRDSLIAVVEVAAAVILYFAGIILTLFNANWHRLARKSST
ncbi:MAG TPA: hypothetical protein VMJ93_16725 [Verrucomicrobiae bacterium]|nr:hypothetical protein [Verrucomicrobiae bacterium]